VLRTGRHSEHAPSRQATKCADSCRVGMHLRMSRDQPVRRWSPSAAVMRVAQLTHAACACQNLLGTAAPVVREAIRVTPVEHVRVTTVTVSHGIAAAVAAAPADVPPQPPAVGAAAMAERPQVPGVLRGCCCVTSAASAVAAGGPVQRQQQPVLPQKLCVRAAPEDMKPNGDELPVVPVTYQRTGLRSIASTPRVHFADSCRILCVSNVRSSRGAIP
jgi:hypothetical protein